MKGLFIAFGLIAALFIANNTQASIYDTATFQTPSSSVLYTVCTYSNASSCITGSELSATALQKCITDTPSQPGINGFTRSNFAVASIDNTLKEVSCSYTHTNNFYPYSSLQGIAKVKFSSQQTISCPPESFPNYIFPLDTDNNGEPEQCFNPLELDNLSKCSELANSGSLLPQGSNSADLTCKTFQDGSMCGFSKVVQGTTTYYQPNLEVNCFGENDIPDYDESPLNPTPQPEQCVPYAGGFACAADPSNYCSTSGECVDGCGYVNDQFICFRDEQCTGASCEPAPVDCTTVPDAPVCKDQQATPEPSFCEKNPSLASCQGESDFCKKYPTAPSCQISGGGTGGGTSFVLDYDRLINGMKDAANLLIDTNEVSDGTQIKSDIEQASSDYQTATDEFLNHSLFDDIVSAPTNSIYSGIENMLPTGGTCSPFQFGEHMTLDVCKAADFIRPFLYFAFAFLTIIYLRDLFSVTIRNSKG